jgi:Alpha-glutamyl/putrescinyl thymine pyrophosphorylase clade 3
MPTFCRHNRFIERCPICSKALPGNAPSAGSTGSARAPRPAAAAKGARRRSGHAEGVRVHRELRAADDGFRSPLVPGLRASADAARLADEISFSTGRLAALAADPAGAYGEARALAAREIEAGTWACFLIAYLCPTESDDPFAGIRAALEHGPCEPFELSGIPLGPRSSHDPARGGQTPAAYRRWAEQAGGQRAAFEGDSSWSPERRFARAFERLALGSFARAGRYELLVILGRLGLYELRADSLHFAGAAGEDTAMLGAKRVFGIGDPLLLERRAAELARAASVPVEALDLALHNWAAPQRATLGFAAEVSDPAAHERASEALGL